MPDLPPIGEQNVALTIAPAEADVRLDKLLVQRLGLGRRAATLLFAQGRVMLAGRRVKKSELARPGDELLVLLGPSGLPTPDPEAALDVRLESPQFVIVSKAAGQPSVPVPGSESGTLASALLAHYPEMLGVGYSPREPGLLHRLDTGTSGLLLAARTPAAFARLREMLRAGRLCKRYLAIVERAGLPGAGEIDSPLAPHPRDRRRMRVAPSENEPGARAAHTSWRVQQRGTRFALLEVDVERALRHQIRVHLASIGHPIVGDTLYGGVEVPGFDNRHALHASHLSWTGDSSLKAFAVDAPLPADMAQLLNE
ncbi:MAG TPA: RluA family pseudouridine synthase [Polyangiaceae bacterium]|nr:RluA family pseudouridine synthase [Polyangiaceae bacterium]